MCCSAIVTLRSQSVNAALTFLHLLAAVLLLARPRLGVMPTVANIPATWRLTLGQAPRAGYQVDAFIAPGLFLILVLMTA
jgi:hypothetical protein